MEDGVPASFLDLILSALAALIILNTISPQYEEQKFVYIDLKLTANSSQINKELKPLLQIKFPDEIASSAHINTSTDFHWNLDGTSLSVYFKMPKSAENPELIIGVFDDSCLLGKEKITATLSYNGIITQSELDETNFYLTKVSAP